MARVYLALSLFLLFEGIWGAYVGEIRQALMAQVGQSGDIEAQEVVRA